MQNKEVFANHDNNQAIRFIQSFDNHPDWLDWDYRTIMIMIQCLRIPELIWSGLTGLPKMTSWVFASTEMNPPSHIDKVHYTGSKTTSVALSGTKVFAPILIYQQISEQDLLSCQKSQPKSRASHDVSLINYRHDLFEIHVHTHSSTG